MGKQARSSTPEGAPGLMVAAEPQWTPEAYAVTKQHMIDVLFGPELRRRIERGAWDESEPVRVAQAVLVPGGKPIVRFNDEARVVLGLVHEQQEVDGELRDVVVDIPWMELEADEAHCGHILFLAVGDREWGAFDARYNLPTVRDHLDAAREFLAGASHALTEGHMRRFAEDLFGAVELTAKAYFIQTPDPRFSSSRRHELIASEFNRERRAGNIDAEHAALLNRLSALRQRPATSTRHTGFRTTKREACLRMPNGCTHGWCPRAFRRAKCKRRSSGA